MNKEIEEIIKESKFISNIVNDINEYLILFYIGNNDAHMSPKYSLSIYERDLSYKYKNLDSYETLKYIAELISEYYKYNKSRFFVTTKDLDLIFKLRQ